MYTRVEGPAACSCPWPCTSVRTQKPVEETELGAPAIVRVQMGVVPARDVHVLLQLVIGALVLVGSVGSIGAVGFAVAELGEGRTTALVLAAEEVLGKKGGIRMRQR